MATLQEFLNELSLNGYVVKDHKEGRINRCATEKSKNSADKSAWFVYKNVGEKFYGIYADFKVGETNYYPSKPEVSERKEIFSIIEKEDDASFMHHVWQSEFNLSEKIKDHPYLSKKQIKYSDLDGEVKLKNGNLLIPLRQINEYRCIRGMQEIDEDGGKKFKPGTKFKGSFFMFKGDSSESYVICEGFATGYAIWRSIGKTVICALSAQNIVPVHKSLREKTEKLIIIACDNDEAGLSPKNKISDENVKFYAPAGEKEDFNDVYCRDGERGVKAYFFPSYSGIFQFGAREYQENWLLEQYLEKSTLFSIIGKSNVGKSFVALYLAMCVANNKPFYGQMPKNPGAVVYVCGEGFRGVNNRIFALKNEYGFSDQEIILTTKPILFLEDASINELSENMKSLKNEEINVSMIIIDTLNTNFGDGDENSTKDITNFMRKVSSLHQIYPDSVIGLVHHTGHQNAERGRGNSAIYASIHTEFLIVEGIRPKEIIIRCTKQKDGEKFNPISGIISTNQPAGVFIENATENISESNLEEIMENTSKSIDGNRKQDQITQMIKIKCAQSDNNQITKSEINHIFGVMGVNKKHQTTYLKRLLSENIIVATTESDIFIVNVY